MNGTHVVIQCGQCKRPQRFSKHATTVKCACCGSYLRSSERVNGASAARVVVICSQCNSRQGFPANARTVRCSVCRSYLRSAERVGAPEIPPTPVAPPLLPTSSPLVLLLNYWRALDPHKFEHEIGLLLVACGARSKVTKQAADGGIDVVITFQRRRYAVQCKRFNTRNAVDRPSCQRLFGVVRAGSFAGGLIVTTSRLGKPAREFCERNRIAFIEGHALAELAAMPSDHALQGILQSTLRVRRSASPAASV